jgi:HD-like signal output (HDOD) protein
LSLFTAAPGKVGAEEIGQVLRQLPSAPKVLPRLLEILRDDNASMDDVVELIRVDSGMASRVLQIANSAYYSPSQSSRCPSMEEAVCRVGLIKVYELVAVAATSQLLMRHLAVYGLSPETMWQRSVTCAIAAEKVAGRFQLDQSTAYTGGLLHAIGLVAVDTWAAGSCPALRLDPDLPGPEMVAQERAVLGATNAAVAGALLRQWGFPSSMLEPVRWQYSPCDAGYHQRMAAVIYLAKWLGNAARLEPAEQRALGTAESAIAPPPSAISESIHATVESLAELLPEILEAVERASLLLAEPAPSAD